MRELVFVALDGLDTALVETWRSDLPTLATLLSGNRCNVTEPLGLPGAFWPSLYAGAGPGQHGTYQQAPAPTSWRLHADRGWTAADLPQLPIVDAVGRQVVNWGVDGSDRQTFATRPTDLATRVHDRVGLPRRVAPDVTLVDPESVACVRDELVERIALKETLFDALCAASPDDAVFIGWGDARTAGEFLWRGTDHPPDALLDVYRAHDAAMARVLDEPARVHAILFRGHVVTARDTGRFLDATTQGLGGTSPVRARRSLAWRLRRWRAPGSPALRRRCRAVANGSTYGAIRVNVRGRDPEGRIRPAEYEAMLDDLTQGLRAVRCTNDERRPIRRVIRTDTVHTGPMAHALPDLLIEWDPGVSAQGVTSDRIGTLAWPSHDPRTGTIAPGATLCVRGRTAPEALDVQDVAAWLGAQP